MRKNKQAAVMVLILVTVFIFLPVQTSAAENVDTSCDVSLRIHGVFEGNSLENMRFDIYLIAGMDEQGKLTPEPEFQKYGDDLSLSGKNEDMRKHLAGTLEQEIFSPDQKNLIVDSSVTDENGNAYFPSSNGNLAPGLYLVAGRRLEKGDSVYETGPSLVSLPEWNGEENAWNYEVEINAKISVKPLTADIRVEKIWKDDCHRNQRPKSVSIQLLCDGKPYGEPVTLPENGRWEHVWEDLNMNHSWTVAEDAADGYGKPDIRQEGNTFIVTNTCNKPVSPSKPSLPQTGQLWWPVPLLTAAGLLFLLIGFLRRRGGRHEK